MRGTIVGKSDVVVDAKATADAVVQSPREVKPGGSNTLQSRDSEAMEALRATCIEATVKGLVDGSAPRLARSRSYP